MSDPFSQITAVTGAMVLWASFMAGFIGSAHCIGMCGGLVLAVAPNTRSVIMYQIGRLVAYTFLGLLGGAIGQLFTLHLDSPWLASLPSFTLGFVFIWMGVTQLNKTKPVMKLPAFLQRWSEATIGRLLRLNLRDSTRSFLVGLFSFLLPCGFLYGAVLISVSFQDPLKAMGIMAFFWLGTVPAMSFAPELLRRFLQPFQSKHPILLSLLFLAIGLGTLGMRFYHLSHNAGVAPSCH